MTDDRERPNGFAMAVVIESALALLAMGLAWIFNIPLRDQMPHSAALFAVAMGRGMVAAAIMLAVFWWLVHSKLPALRALRRQVDEVIAEMFPYATLAQLATVALLAGVGEELLFRGCLQPLIGRWTTPLIGIVAASVLFGGAHALSRVYFALATILGLGLGWMTWYYNDLVGPMVAHTVYDFVALVYLVRQRRATVR